MRDELRHRPVEIARIAGRQSVRRQALRLEARREQRNFKPDVESAAGLIGVLGVIGPTFAKESLGLETADVWVLVLPLGAGVVLGVLALNSYGRYFPRRRLIEVGLVIVGALVGLLSVAGPISRFLQGVTDRQPVVDLSGVVSLLAVVVVLAFSAGIAYAFVAIPAQTQLQEELPEDVRGRVFGVLNMLVSVASFLPIIIVGFIVDMFGTTLVIAAVEARATVGEVAAALRDVFGEYRETALD